MLTPAKHDSGHRPPTTSNWQRANELRRRLDTLIGWLIRSMNEQGPSTVRPPHGTPEQNAMADGERALQEKREEMLEHYLKLWNENIDPRFCHQYAHFDPDTLAVETSRWPPAGTPPEKIYPDPWRTAPREDGSKSEYLLDLEEQLCADAAEWGMDPQEFFAYPLDEEDPDMQMTEEEEAEAARRTDLNARFNFIAHSGLEELLARARQ